MSRPPEDPRGLERFERRHAVLALAAFAAALWVGRAWPAAAVGLASLLTLLTLGGWRSGPGRRLGAANLVTSFRALLVLAGALADGARGTWLALLVLGVLALDGVDGWLARRTRSESALGALFDLETDSLLVLVAGLLLYQRGDLGVWILLSGPLRYLYVLVRALVPARHAGVPRTRFGRFAFLALALGLAAAFALPPPLGTALAALGTALVGASFARSFYESYV